MNNPSQLDDRDFIIKLREQLIQELESYKIALANHERLTVLKEQYSKIRETQEKISAESTRLKQMKQILSSQQSK